ncbi:MAG: hypothetical protein CM1200mP41_36890 [Gammaproteobacteria bacterium]|nr:MAG: hypothetical protein CM1200mP41_36890 [Gammaproteobacteria bacterium]
MVAVDGHLNGHPDHVVGDAVIIQPVVRLPGAIRQFSNGLLASFSECGSVYPVPRDQISAKFFVRFLTHRSPVLMLETMALKSPSLGLADGN